MATETRTMGRAAALSKLSRFTRSLEFRAALADIPGHQGRYTVVPALHDDQMGYVLSKFQETEDHTGVIVMVKDGQIAAVAVLFRASDARVTVAEEDDALMAVNDQSSVSFFFHALETCRRDMIIQRVAAARLVSPELCS